MLVKLHPQSGTESNACTLAAPLHSPLLPSSESSAEKMVLLTGVCFITSINLIKIASHRQATGQPGLHNPNGDPPSQVTPGWVKLTINNHHGLQIEVRSRTYKY